MSADIGVVVIGRNEGPRLIACLQSVKPQSASAVYVDSGSSDGSVAAAERLGVRVVNLDTSRPFTAARARNEGFAALMQTARNLSYVQFVDGDCELDPAWLGKAADFLDQHGDVGAVCGRRKERYPERTLYNRLCDIEWNTAVGDTTACGGDVLMRRAAFEAVGGYRPQLIAGEEPELCVRLRKTNWKIFRLDAEMTRHDAAMSRFGQWWKRTVRSGYAFVEIWWLHRGSRFAIYGKETSRAIFWGGVLPSIIVLGALAWPPVILMLLIYLVQILRIVLRRKIWDMQSCEYAFFIVLGKFAEFQGVAKYCIGRWRNMPTKLIEYK